MRLTQRRTPKEGLRCTQLHPLSEGQPLWTTQHSPLKSHREMKTGQAGWARATLLTKSACQLAATLDQTSQVIACLLPAHEEQTGGSKGFLEAVLHQLERLNQEVALGPTRLGQMQAEFPRQGLCLRALHQFPELVTA
jgi:hypothetical protein